MFTGIIEAALPLKATADGGGVRRLTLDLGLLPQSDTIKLGDSVALNGCCLTVAELSGTVAVFEAIPETLGLTNLGDLQPGSIVNVERALQAGARFDGHFVQGHIDSRGAVEEIRDDGGEWRIRVDCGKDFGAQCIPKGSVCIDGISLTIAELAANSFVVAVIPHTRKITNIQSWKRGTSVNLEADLIGKYVRRQMQGTSGVTDELLRSAGFDRA